VVVFIGFRVICIDWSDGSIVVAGEKWWVKAINFINYRLDVLHDEH
jgi:hypothetical protein